MLDLKKDIEDFILVFLDIETTGLSLSDGDSICEIAAIKTEKRKIIDVFKSLINPEKEVSFGAYNLHRLSNKELQKAPLFKDVAGDLIKFINSSIVCAYNANFDIGFINQQLYKISYSQINVPVIDIFSMAKNTISLSRYNLENIAKFFDIKYTGSLHRAETDAYLAYEIFFKLRDILKEKNINNLEDYIYFFGK